MLEWYSKPVGVAPYYVKRMHVPRELPPGRPIKQVGTKAHRVVTSPTTEERLRPTIEPLPKGSSFIADETQLASTLEEGRLLAALFEASKHPWAAAELSQAKKLCLQRGGPPGWWFDPNGMIVRDGGDMDEAIDAICDTVLQTEEDEAPAAGTRYKQHTNHGYPDYGDSDLSFVFHALWAATARTADGGLSWDAFSANGVSLADVMGQGETPFSSIEFSRSGPLAKPVAAYDLTGEMPVQIAELSGACARKREVLGNATGGNMAAKPHVDRVKSRCRRIPQIYHPGGPEAVGRRVRARRAVGTKLWSDDVEKYDKHVRPNHLARFRARLHDQMGVPGWSEFKSHWGDMPLLVPAITANSEAWLYVRRGGIASGTIDTSLDGTLVNLARVVTAVAAATGRRPREVWAARGAWWDCWIQGDDTMLDLPHWADLAKYVACSRELGYPCKLEEFAVFLMHAYDRDGNFAPLLARVHQQTKMNEYGGESLELELMAFVARTERFWTRSPWTREASMLFEGAPCFAKYGVRPSLAASALSDPRFKLEVAKSLHSERRRKVERRLADIAARSSALSDFAAGLLTPNHPNLPHVAPDTALDDAKRIAGYMGIPADERPKLDSLGVSDTVRDYLAYINAQNFEETIDDRQGSEFEITDE